MKTLTIIEGVLQISQCFITDEKHDGLLPLVLARLKDYFRYDQSSSNDIPCDPDANIGVSLLGLSSPRLLQNSVPKSVLVALTSLRSESVSSPNSQIFSFRKTSGTKADLHLLRLRAYFHKSRPL